MPSKLDKTYLFDLLGTLEEYLSMRITLVAAGGTAMTLLDLKSSTIDIDFTGPTEDINEFDRVQKMISHGHKIDLYYNGAVFSQVLPSDYLDRSKKIRTELRRIDLRALHPVDIIVTKIGRLSTHDRQDIESCIRKYGITKEAIIERAEPVAISYPGNVAVYRDNLNSVIQMYFQT